MLEFSGAPAPVFDKGFFCSPGYPGVRSADQAGLFLLSAGIKVVRCLRPTQFSAF